MRNRAAALALLLALGLLAGCTGLQTDGSGLPSGADAEAGYAALESVEGTVEYGYQSDGNASNTTVRMTARPKERMTRQRVLGPARLAGDETVTNGSVSWLYDESENGVTRISLGELNFSTTSNAAFVSRVFGNLTESGENAIVLNPQLPVGPLRVGGGDPTPITADLIGPTQFTVSHVGTETVAGRRAHGVELDPVNESADGLSGHIENATYWFDAEYFFPLRTETAISIDGAITTSTRAYRNVTFNPDLGADTFRFDPPPNATVETPPEPRTATFDTAAGAAANVSFAVGTPDAPDSDLETARVSRMRNRTTVSLEYADGTGEFTVTSRSPPLDSRLDGEPVALGEVNATRTSIADTVALRWRCGGVEYTVRGDRSETALTDVAETVAPVCDGR